MKKGNISTVDAAALTLARETWEDMGDTSLEGWDVGEITFEQIATHHHDRKVTATGVPPRCRSPYTHIFYMRPLSYQVFLMSAMRVRAGEGYGISSDGSPTTQNVEVIKKWFPQDQPTFDYHGLVFYEEGFRIFSRSVVNLSTGEGSMYRIDRHLTVNCLISYTDLRARIRKPHISLSYFRDVCVFLPEYKALEEVMKKDYLFVPDGPPIQCEGVVSQPGHIPLQWISR